MTCYYWSLKCGVINTYSITMFSLVCSIIKHDKWICTSNNYNTSMRFVTDLKCDTWGYGVYKSDTNWMDVLQLFCFMVCKWIKGFLSLCLAWRTILYCWSCAVEWCRWFSRWKALGFLPLSRNKFTMPTHVIFLAFRLSTNIPLTLLTSWLLALYARSALCIMANYMCMALQ